MLAPDRAEEILKIFLTTPFQGGRHDGRVAKIHDAEKSAS
jgi:ribose 5-phosphate isomerase RpiB